mmetsp:Transcript_15740/g.47968  ORF Transcript_15740/g.47968 Transcript_15740/m.47968 type:complete len:456 (+) Transcript_15740:523-1890(+)
MVFPREREPRAWRSEARSCGSGGGERGAGEGGERDRARRPRTRSCCAALERLRNAAPPSPSPVSSAGFSAEQFPKVRRKHVRMVFVRLRVGRRRIPTPTAPHDALPSLNSSTLASHTDSTPFLISISQKQPHPTASRKMEQQQEPQAVATSMGGGGKKASATARIGGSIISGFCEIGIFHPVDTVAKRLMSHRGAVAAEGGSGVSLSTNQIIFREAANEPLMKKWGSLFPGVGFGLAYKILQRTYKFGGQLYVRDAVAYRFGDSFTAAFGDKNGKAMMHAFAGSMIGVGEVALLPLDVLKIKAQTNPESLKGRGVFNIFAEEGFALYRGAGWTAARNAPGSFALFGGAAVARNAMGLKEGQTPTWVQSFVSSVAGATASISVASPMDVVKTRIQNRDFNDPRSGSAIVTDLLRHEGPGAFFKGLAPKLAVVGPKLVFSFAVAQKMIAMIDDRLQK